MIFPALSIARFVEISSVIFLLNFGKAKVASTGSKGKSVPFLAKEAEKQKLVLTTHELELHQAVKTKIEKPLFETSIRLYVKTNDQKEEKQRVSGFLATLGQLTSPYQSLIAKPVIKILPFPKLSSKNFAERDLSLFDNPILSSSELADLYHFPYAGTTKTEDMVKGKSQPLPAPLSFKQTENKFDNVFAKNNYGGSETLIGQTLEERRRHTYILGATGSGKTTLLSDMIYQDIVNGKGVAVLDPHGQLVEKLLTVIPENRIKDVVWFAPDDDGFPIALNLLELPKGTFTASQLQKQKSLVASSIISIIQKFYDAKFFGPRMEYVLRNTILTALETESPTLLTVLDILTKTPYRKKVVSELKNQVLKDYCVYEFEKLGSLQRNNVVSPITNKIGGILSSPINYNILCQEESKLDFEDVINNGKILLCDLSKGKIGEDESSFFGSLIVAKIQLAALRRALIPEEERKDFYLYIDEFQNFATSTFAELVSEARKYRLSTILAHQSISQIENRDIIKVILANVGTVICFKTANPEDEQFILPIFSPEVLKHEISNLPLYNFYMKVSVGQAQDTFLAQADNFTVESNKNIEQSVIELSRRQYSNPVRTSPVKDEKTDEEMRQNTSETVSQLVKTNETQKGQIHAQNAENFCTYPIQEGSKDGIGIINNKEKNVSITTQKETSPITIQQQQILSLLHRFRFLDRTQIQQFLNHKNHKRIILWLNDLLDKKLIKLTKLPKSKAKIYYLTKNSIPLLLEEDDSNKQSLQKLYSENERSNSFIESCLLIADIYLDLQSKTNENKKIGMYVKSDYQTMPLAESLNDLSPHAFIEQINPNETKYCFLEILANLPEERLRQRIKKYLRFYQENAWEAETGMPFPTVLIICPNDEVFKYVKSYAKSKLRELDEPSLTVRLSTVEKVKEFGIGGDVWTTL
ncbi:MAG: AAA-like domain protein [bacterium ADurb.Bin212]|nr:MAG: AAA-like domain protein [bacterium ADurb.Bin212]